MREIGGMYVVGIAINVHILFTVFLSIHLAVWRITWNIEIIAVGCKESFQMLGVLRCFHYCRSLYTSAVDSESIAIEYWTRQLL